MDYKGKLENFNFEEYCLLGCDADSPVEDYQRFGRSYCIHPQDGKQATRK
jgi:hypothetical protein